MRYLLSVIALIAIAFPVALDAQQYPIQKPGAIQVPKGPWQTPGQIQVPKGIQAIKTTTQSCSKKYTVGADALFAFGKFTLSSDAQKTLGVLGPMLKKAAGHPIHIDGYTDSIGSDAYNMTLSLERAKTVRDWLVQHGYIPSSTPYAGHGKADPVAPNTNPDGSDNPSGRQKNRRVEVTVNTCR